jgi:putative peptidoglycan lipid II flippase
VTDIQPEQSIPNRKPSMAKTFGIVAVLTVLSKFAGLARDIMVARAYGTGVISDAYNYAYMFTGNILILLGGLGGPFHACTVSVVGHHKDDKDAGVLVTQVMAITILVMAAATVAVYLIGHLWLVPKFAAEYKNKDGQLVPAVQQALATSTLQQLDIMLPMIVIAGVIGVIYGVLNIFNKVAWPSISPAIASLAIIIALVLFNDPHSGIPLAIGTLAGAVGQLLVQLPAFFTSGFNYSLTFKPHPDLKKYLWMLFPAILGTQIGQITVYVDSGFANMTGSGSWTAIVNANRLIQLPLGVLLTAMLVPVQPRFTEHVKEERLDELKDDIRRALRVLWFLGLPLSAVLLALPGEIHTVLFQRGEWTDYSTWVTAAALILLVPSIFFYLARDLVTRVFYAYHDSRSPFIVASIAILIKYALDYALVVIVAPMLAPSLYQYMGAQLPFEAHGQTIETARQATALAICGVAGVSLATTLMTLINLAFLTALMRKKIGLLGFRKLVGPATIMVSASALCFITTFGAYRGIEHLLPANHICMLINIAMSSAVGMLVYVGICLAGKLDEPRTVARRLPFVKRLVP